MGERDSSQSPGKIISIGSYRRAIGLTEAVQKFIEQPTYNPYILLDSGPTPALIPHDPTDAINPDEVWKPIADVILHGLRRDVTLTDHQVEEIYQNMSSDGFYNALTFEQSGDFFDYIIDALYDMNLPPQSVPENVIDFFIKRRTEADPNS